MRGSWTIGWALTVACGDVVSGPPLPDPPPVVEVVLIAGSSAATARIRSVQPGTGADQPIGPDRVRLRLGTGELEAPFVPIADSAGYYRATLPITPGGRYQMWGTVAGVATKGATVVPGPLLLREPRPDSIVLELGRIARFRVEWLAPGASRLVSSTGYFVGPGGSGALTATRDSSAEFVIAPPDAPGDVAVEWWAENPELDRYLSTTAAPRSNLEGAFGVLGAASRAGRILRWR